MLKSQVKANRIWLFLLCSERGGSNLITSLMNSHSAISGPAPKHLINPIARNFFRYQPLSDSSWRALLNDLVQLFNVDFSFWQTNISVEELQKEVEVGDFGQLYTTIYGKEALGKPVSFVKEIKVHEFFPFLTAWFPEARYVHLIRDPREVALSWKKSKTHKGGVVAGAQQWKLDQQKYGMFCQLPGIKERSHSLSYERLVAAPEQVLSPVLNQIGYSWEDAMLYFHNRKDAQKNAANQTAWENLARPIMSNNISKYLTELNDAEIALVERICYFDMLQWGYTPQYSWETLEVISESDLEQYHLRECESLLYHPAETVLRNMAAKAVFYRHLEPLGKR